MLLFIWLTSNLFKLDLKYFQVNNFLQVSGKTNHFTNFGILLNLSPQDSQSSPQVSIIQFIFWIHFPKVKGYNPTGAIVGSVIAAIVVVIIVVTILTVRQRIGYSDYDFEKEERESTSDLI